MEETERLRKGLIQGRKERASVGQREVQGEEPDRGDFSKTDLGLCSH